MGFVPDHLTDGPLTILAQNPGANEEHGERILNRAGDIERCTPQPLIGKTGYDLTTKYLPLTGVSRDEVSLCNVLKCRWKHTNEMPTVETYVQAVQHCTTHHLRVPRSSRLLVAMGAHAWGFLGGPSPLSDWRGFLSPQRYQDIPVFSTIHLADLYRDPKLTVATRADYHRLGRYLRGEWPRPVPENIVLDHMTIDRAGWWIEQARRAPYVAIDTEYNPETRELYLLGMGIPGGYPTLQVEWRHCSRDAFLWFVGKFRTLVQEIPCVFQNALADIPILRDAPVTRACIANHTNYDDHQWLGITWKDYRQIDDTLQAAACLWSELPKDLEFLASIYGQYDKMKHLARTDPRLYNQGDVLETIAVWESQQKEFDRDPQSYGVYRTQNMRLLNIVAESMERGISVNSPRVLSAYTAYQAKVEEAQRIAWAYAGWPINLGSDDQMGHWLYDIEGQKEQTAKRKKKGEKPTRSRTVNEDAIAVLRGKWLEFDPDSEITVDGTVERIHQGGHPLLEAKVLYTGASHAISNYLKPLMVDQ